MIFTPLSVTTSFVRPSIPATLPPLEAAMSTTTEPGFIEATISSVISRGARDVPGSARW